MVNKEHKKVRREVRKRLLAVAGKTLHQFCSNCKDRKMIRDHRFLAVPRVAYLF